MTPRKLDLVALVIGLIASFVGVFGLIAAFATAVNWQFLSVLAPVILIGIGVMTLVVAVRKH